MTTIVVLSSAILTKQAADPKIVHGLAKGTVIILAVYAAFRLGDMLLKDNLGLAFAGTFISTFFVIEVVGGVLLPMLLLNRLNVAFFTQAQDGATYLPSVTEFLLSFGLVAGAILLFKAAVVHLPIIQPAQAKAA